MVTHFFADDEIIIASCENTDVLRAFNILGYALTVIKILIPIVIILTGIRHLMKAVLEENDVKDSVYLLIKKFIVGAAIFFIPTIINTAFSVVSKYEGIERKFSNCGRCLTSVSDCQKLINSSKAKWEKYLASIDDKYVGQSDGKMNDTPSVKVPQATSPQKNPSSGGTYNPGGSSGSPESGGTTAPVTPVTSTTYGKGCTGYVSSSSYNQALASSLLQKASQKIGVSYSKMDCSDFVSWVFSSYVGDNTAAGLGKATSDNCVKLGEVKPGDVFFTSRYNSSGKCTNCTGATHGNRCNRYNCIMHVGIVVEVQGGMPTKIIHSSGKGVHYANPSYKSAPSSGSAWYIQFTRPYV